MKPPGKFLFETFNSLRLLRLIVAAVLRLLRQLRSKIGMLCDYLAAQHRVFHGAKISGLVTCRFEFSFQVVVFAT